MQIRSSQFMWRVPLQIISFSCFLLTTLLSQVQAGQTPEGLSDLKWGNIQQQVTMSRYKAFAQEDGSYASANIANGWHIDYGSDGHTTLTPYQLEDSEYFIGLQLKSLGYASQSAYNKPQQITSDESKLTYQWDENVKEIWTNSSNRLEQWFEIQQRPQGVRQDQKLTLQMALTTDLQVVQNGNALNFANKISYDKLKVWDSTGTEIPASMHLQNNTLSLVIDDSLAVYPLTIDPSFQQQAYLKALNTEASDQFGWSVDISGDTLVVGAFQEDSNATGVDGDETDNSANWSGAAYVFTRTAGVWSHQAYLKASNTDASDQFGYSVAISGDTLVVGAHLEESNATGVNGDETNNLVEGAGAAYVFTRTAGVWSQQAYLKASATERFDLFGRHVAISGDTLVVGAYSEDSNATGVNGDDTNNDAFNAGAAYVFTRTAGVWSQQAYLKASNTETRDAFGWPVVISGDTVVVGAQAEDSNATGVNGVETDNSAVDSGAAYVFTRTGTTWSQQAYLKASNTGASDWFGISLGISGDTLVAGTPREDSNTMGVNGVETDNSAADSGAAYVFTRSGTVWSQQAYLKASNTGAGDNFARFAVISGDTLMVVANTEDSNAAGVDGDETNDLAENSGAGYVFTRTGTTWSQQAYLKASNAEANDYFGASAAISGDTLLVSAVHEDSSATGVDGIESDNSMLSSGAAYVFNSLAVVKTDQTITDFTATPSSGVVNGTSVLSATGGASGNPVIFGSNTPAVCTVAGSTVSYVTAGTCTVTADQAGDASYNPAPQITLDITVFKLNQSITGLVADPATGSVAGTSTLSATASSGLPVIFASVTPTVCTVAGFTVSYLIVGTCTVTADQAGDATYNPATQVTLDIGVGLTDQAITNFVATPATGVVNGSSALSATGGASGNPVVFGSNTPAVCTVAVSTVSYVTAGTCTVTADQAGNASYNAAPQVTLNITVAEADQTITGLAANPATGVAGGTSALSASASSGLTVTFDSSTSAVCTVAGSTVTYVMAGTCTVTADQAGDANYNAAPQVTLDINVTEALPVMPNVPIPTLSRWGLVVMFMMLLLIGGMIVRRKTLG